MKQSKSQGDSHLVKETVVRSVRPKIMGVLTESPSVAGHIEPCNGACPISAVVGIAILVPYVWFGSLLPILLFLWPVSGSGHCSPFRVRAQNWSKSEKSWNVFLQHLFFLDDVIFDTAMFMLPHCGGLWHITKDLWVDLGTVSISRRLFQVCGFPL